MADGHVRRTYRIGVIPGDGIGPEVVESGLAVVETAGTARDVNLKPELLPWGCDYYRKTGKMMPKDGLEVLDGFDAFYFGAVGSPEVADDVSVWGLLMPIRKMFDLYINIRPVKAFPGLHHPRLRRTDDIDMLIVRENTEGEYSNVGGRVYQGAEIIATQLSVFSARRIERAVEFAFSQASSERGVVSVTKSNALAHSMTLWDEVAAMVATRYPSVPFERMHVDAAAYRMILNPDSFKVVVASNLFGDILSDLAAGLIGSLGLAASGNINPVDGRGLFEPVHGSAPDIAGRGVANPIGAILSGAMMLDFLGEPAVALDIRSAVEDVLAAGVGTPDLGGTATTSELGHEVIARLRGRADRELGS